MAIGFDSACNLHDPCLRTTYLGEQNQLSAILIYHYRLRRYVLLEVYFKWKMDNSSMEPTASAGKQQMKEVIMVKVNYVESSENLMY